jgi:hypothetical protein
MSHFVVLLLVCPYCIIFTQAKKKTTKRTSHEALTTGEALDRDMSAVQLFTLRQLRAATLCGRHSTNGDVHCLVMGTGHMQLDPQRLAVWATEMVIPIALYAMHTLLNVL